MLDEIETRTNLLAYIYWKSIIKTIGQGVKYVQSKQ